MEPKGEPEGPLTAEISPRRMKLMLGERSFEIPREYFRAVYDAMVEAARLKEGETRVLELRKKAPPQAPKVGSPEWFRRIIPL